MPTTCPFCLDGCDPSKHGVYTDWLRYWDDDLIPALKHREWEINHYLAKIQSHVEQPRSVHDMARALFHWYCVDCQEVAQWLWSAITHDPYVSDELKERIEYEMDEIVLRFNRLTDGKFKYLFDKYFWEDAHLDNMGADPVSST